MLAPLRWPSVPAEPIAANSTVMLWLAAGTEWFRRNYNVARASPTRWIMQTSLKALSIFGLGALLLLPAAPSVSAADLGLRPIKKRVVIHHRSRIVRDLDGTPIIVRRARPLMFTGYDGTVVLRHLYENISVR